MKNPQTICRDERRRHAVRRSDKFNGLDYLEVSNDQKKLIVYFLEKAPEHIQKENVRITGGRRIRNIQVVEIRMCRQEDPERDDCIIVTVDKPGDFSTYTLCLVDLDQDKRPTDKPFPGFDPRYACLDFSFKIGCPSDLDCKQVQVCPPPHWEEPEINYLAKDYASFRQLILDRLSLIMPEWKERHVPDIGIALVEILAYVGDHLSYYQDAVATEAYLATARQRISVRRHARLVDYHMHEGCNARTWVCAEIHGADEYQILAKDACFITHYDDAQVPGKPLTRDDLIEIPASRYEVFEPIVETAEDLITLYNAHNEIHFYTWGDKECCLLRGATSATLRDGVGVIGLGPQSKDETTNHKESINKKKEKATNMIRCMHELQLKPGDFLLFEEVIGPKTGNPADADPLRRHVVRLTTVEPELDELYNQPVLKIGWSQADALPFPLCISTIGPAPDCNLLDNVSVARGNVILVDHGRHIEDESLGTLPLHTRKAECGDRCHPIEDLIIPGKFRPRLQKSPLTFSQPIPLDTPASALVFQDPRQALPNIDLYSIPPAYNGSVALFDPKDLKDPTNLAARLKKASDPVSRHLRAQLGPNTHSLLNEYDGTSEPSAVLREALVSELNRLLCHWTPRQDILGSLRHDPHFVVEVDNDGLAHLRFGDGELGRKPEAGSFFVATYRIGNGPAGNVGAESISHIILKERVEGLEIRPRNPFPVQGGMPPEPLTEVKLFAPYVFRTRLERAITAEDYSTLVMHDFSEKIQRAAAKLRWTGSWYEMLVVIDPLGKVEADEGLLREITDYLRRYRRIAHDVVVKSAHYVPLDIEMTICVHPDYLSGHVKAVLLELFSNRILPDGGRGFFHPDNLTFGEGIRLSRLVASAQTVEGVENVIVTKLERLYEGPNLEIENGILPLGPMEIARLDNDPSFPENGQFQLNMRGGR